MEIAGLRVFGSQPHILGATLSAIALVVIGNLRREE